MTAAEETKFSIRVVIEKEKEKVLFAEVNGDFADTLISFLTLPLGTIVRLLVKHYGDQAPAIGSLNALYKSLENLDRTNFWTTEGKLMLLNPRNPFEAHLRKLRINIDDTESTKYFICESLECTRSKVSANVSMYYDSDKCSCGKSMNSEIKFASTDENNTGQAFTTETASFIVSDDLQLLPNLAESGIEILKKLGIEGTFPVEERTLLFGFNEIMALLKLSLISSTPLSDLVFEKNIKTVPVTITSFEPCTTTVTKDTENSNIMKMGMNIVVQKSTGKVIQVQTGENFVDFLFGLLSIPLGRAFSLLGSNVFKGSIHNLYMSLASLNSKGNLFDLKIEKTFSSTKLPPMYVSKHQPLPISSQQIPNPLYCCIIYNPNTGQYRNNGLSHVTSAYDKNVSVSVKDPKGLQGSYVKGPAMFLVTDSLVVMPISTISSFSILNNLKIPVSDVDVEEHFVEIGTDEALNILKASLLSTSVLTNCLKPMLKRWPKQDK